MSTPLRKGIKKFQFMREDLDDFITAAKFAKDSKAKKPIKRQQVVEAADEELSEPTESIPVTSKKTKVSGELETGQIVHEKLINVMDNQLNNRKESNEQLLKSLVNIIDQMKEDNIALKNNQQKLQHLSTALVKCMEQATLAQEQKLKDLTDIFNFFKKKVEGLIIRGGMKPDERPLWFDVYKAFPPLAPPVFARPKPQITHIKQILYKEDALRAKFHDKGHGLGAVNMLVPGDTPTKKLLKHYEQLSQEENLTEDEKITKCLEVAAAERQEKREANRVSETDTVDRKPQKGAVLTELDIKNIFKNDTNV